MSEPIHDWFELSYSNYLVLPRSILQSAPVEWQRRFVTCLHELKSSVYHLDVNDNYTVLLKDGNGHFTSDPYSDYQRGRRRVPLDWRGV